MPVIEVVLSEPAFADYKIEEIVHLGEGALPIRITGLTNGMTSRKPSVGIGIQLPNHRLILAETSLALFLAAADMLKAKYGDPR
jgi:hypothetical protein